LERELWAEISRESSGDGCLKREEPTSVSPLLTLLLGMALTRAGKMECCLSYSEATTEYDLWKTVLFARSVSVMGLVSKLQIEHDDR